MFFVSRRKCQGNGPILAGEPPNPPKQRQLHFPKLIKMEVTSPEVPTLHLKAAECVRSSPRRKQPVCLSPETGQK